MAWLDSDGLTGFKVVWADSQWCNPFCDYLTGSEVTRPYPGWRGGVRDNAVGLEVGYEHRDLDLTLWIVIWGLMFGSEVLKALGSRLTAPRLGLNRRQNKHWSGTGIGIKRAAPNALRCLFGTHTHHITFVLVKMVPFWCWQFWCFTFIHHLSLFFTEWFRR